MTPEEILQSVIAKAKYTRWNYDANRRETWTEAVSRTMDDYATLADGALSHSELHTLQSLLENQEAMGAMRMLKMAGKAFARSNIVAYNCASMPVDRLEAFHDLMILGMSGVGVTVSVEERFIEQLPTVYSGGKRARVTVVVDDSTEGWAKASMEAIRCFYGGHDVLLDTRKVRPAGSILKTKGGRASGPKPLETAIRNIGRIILNASGRKLNSAEVMDVCNHLAEATVQGGVRRVALMGLADKGDELMWHYKRGEWYKDPVLYVRSNANISVVLDGGEDRAFFDRLLDEILYGSGEPSFYNRAVAVKRFSPERRARCSDISAVMPNPCGEINNDPWGLCNLSMWVARPGLSKKELLRRATGAAIFGVLQAKATHFPDLLIPQWEENAKRLALLGVSPTGVADTPELRSEDLLRELYHRVVEVAQNAADRLGIPHPASYTSIKPAGNSSLLTNTSPGINPRLYRYALRRVAFRTSDPILRTLKASGVPVEGKIGHPEMSYALFPLAAPYGSVVATEQTAIEQMERYYFWARHYVDQSISNTINFSHGEEEAIKDWLWKHRDGVISMTFAAKLTEHYPQLPIEELTIDAYKDFVTKFPKFVDWGILNKIERPDYIEAQEITCGSGLCNLM